MCLNCIIETKRPKIHYIPCVSCQKPLEWYPGLLLDEIVCNVCRRNVHPVHDWSLTFLREFGWRLSPDGYLYDKPQWFKRHAEVRRDLLQYYEEERRVANGGWRLTIEWNV
jgi:hypothetical protein